MNIGHCNTVALKGHDTLTLRFPPPAAQFKKMQAAWEAGKKQKDERKKTVVGMTRCKSKKKIGSSKLGFAQKIQREKTLCDI